MIFIFYHQDTQLHEMYLFCSNQYNLCNDTFSLMSYLSVSKEKNMIENFHGKNSTKYDNNFSMLYKCNENF